MTYSRLKWKYEIFDIMRKIILFLILKSFLVINFVIAVFRRLVGKSWRLKHVAFLSNLLSNYNYF